MAVIVSQGGTYTPHPEGQFRAVLVDVVEQRDVETAWGPKTKVRLVFQTEHALDDGRPAMASARFNASLHENGRLLPFLEAWRGKKFTPAELRAFDLEQLLGVQAVIQIQHTEKDGRVYDNIQAIMRPMKGMTPLAASDYTRQRDRDAVMTGGNLSAKLVGSAAQALQSLATPPAALEDDDDSLPF